MPLTASDLAHLTGVHPRLVALLAGIAQILEDEHTPIFVPHDGGVRSTVEQQALFARGRDVTGTILDRRQVVTSCDGVVKRSNHQAHADGFGHAVDVAFRVGKGQNPWDDRHPWARYGALVRQAGLRWGGDWTLHPDRPHAELPDDA